MRMKAPAAMVSLIVLLADGLALTREQSTAPGTVTTTPSCPELATALTAMMRSDARVRDWANLTRYRDDNRTLPPAAAGVRRIVFMGDSITDVWPQPRFGEFFVGKPYVGRGISGQTTPQMFGSARTSSP
jgi:acyl-CoA thioesterase-1